MKTLITALFMALALTSFAQKKVLDHPDFDIWNRIQASSISADGNFIMYSLQKGEKDSHLMIKDSDAKTVFQHERGEKGKFSWDSEFAVFTVMAWKDSVKEMKRRKVKKADLPKDSLAIYNLSSKSLTKIGHIESYKLPEKWSTHLAYQLTDIKAVKKEEKEQEEDKSEEEESEVEKEKTEKTKSKKKAKKVGKENGYHLVVRNLATGAQDTIKYVTNYVFAKEGQRLAYVTTGIDSVLQAGVYVVDLETNQTTNVLGEDKGKYSNLAFSESGKHLGFIADLDTTKALVRPNELYYFVEGTSAAEKLMDENSAPGDYLVSADGKISFSEDETRMFFGLATQPIVKDTTLLDEEIVNVEVWTYNEPQLYTYQELQVKNEEKRSYQSVIHLKDKKTVQLATTEYPDIDLGDEGNAAYALLETSKPY